jgi:hypothetical protein
MTTTSRLFQTLNTRRIGILSSTSVPSLGVGGVIRVHLVGAIVLGLLVGRIVGTQLVGMMINIGLLSSLLSLTLT